MRRRFLTLATLAVSTVLIAACGQDNPTAPVQPSAPSTRIAAPSTPQFDKGKPLPKPEKVTPLQRDKSLPGNQTASVTVGLLGGTVSLPAAGFTLLIPPGAAPIGTKITVSAGGGKDIAYTFEPHGLQFALPLIATQDLRNTNAAKLPWAGLLDPSMVMVGYVPDPSLPTTITELLSVSVNVFDQKAIFGIWHFSGYIFGGGRMAAEF